MCWCVINYIYIYRNKDIWVSHFFFIVTVDDLLSKTSRLLWWSPPIVCWALHIENRYFKFFEHRMFYLRIIYSTRTAYHITKTATAFFEENYASPQPETNHFSFNYFDKQANDILQVTHKRTQVLECRLGVCN